MTSLDSTLGGIGPDEIVVSSDSDVAGHAAGHVTTPTQNNIHKSQPGPTFRCRVKGCRKSYSRAGHLHRHQLNRMSILLNQIPILSTDPLPLTPSIRHPQDDLPL